MIINIDLRDSPKNKILLYKNNILCKLHYLHNYTYRYTEIKTKRIVTRSNYILNLQNLNTKEIYKNVRENEFKKLSVIEYMKIKKNG